MAEVWKDVVNYKGFYQVSNKGRVRSIGRTVKNGANTFYFKKGKIMKQIVGVTGYYKITLSVDKKTKEKKVHHLVLDAFVGERPVVENERIVTNHKDCNKLNNNVENLEWVTQKENVRHALRNGAKKLKDIPHDTLHKLYIVEGLSIKKIAIKLKSSERTVTKLLTKKGLKGEAKTPPKYNIDRDDIVGLFKKGLKNYEIADMYKCPVTTIAGAKYRLKKRGLIC